MLTDTAVRKAKAREKRYRLADGQRSGLFLLVLPTGGKLWQFRFKLSGKEGVYSIGSYPDVSLEQARAERKKASDRVREGTHPTAGRQAELRQVLETSEATLGRAWEGLNLTLSGLAEKTMDRRKREFDKDLGAYFGRAALSFTRAELSGILKKIDARAPSVARNIHGYLNGAFQYAMDTGMLSTNPVPQVRILGAKKAESHKALEPHRLGDFLVDLSQSTRLHAISRVSMLLAIQTAVRKQEATGARWSEMDLERKEWVIPAERMKGKLEHYVPLSKQTIALLRSWRSQCDPNHDLLFPNRRDSKRPMAGRSLNNVMDKLGYLAEGVPHGMRSCFSTYANGRFKHHADAVERCLAHVEKDKVRGAYNRYEYKIERQKLMHAWGDQLSKLESEAAARRRASSEESQPGKPANRGLPQPDWTHTASNRIPARTKAVLSDRLAKFRSARLLLNGAGGRVNR